MAYGKGGFRMADREKVIKGLECCTKKVCIYKDTENECPYCELCGEYEDAFEDCTTALAKDAIALLKAQEPVMVEERADTDTINCPKCGQQFARVGRDKSIYLDTDEEPNYCPKCGQAVKWE